MRIVDIEDWLAAHSVKREQSGSEILFTHKTGETSILLLPRARSEPKVPARNRELEAFYDVYAGASIGNSQLVIGTNTAGGVQISHGFLLQDLDQMAETTRKLGVQIAQSERVFMAEAAWMFIYTVSDETGNPEMWRYDRDFRTRQAVPDLQEVLESWRSLVEADS